MLQLLQQIFNLQDNQISYDYGAEQRLSVCSLDQLMFYLR